MAIYSEATLNDVSGQSYVRSSRLFYLDPAEHASEGWYFKVRGPRYYGPYLSRNDASAVLERMVNEYLASNETGGR
jgi:hypothetical protein